MLKKRPLNRRLSVCLSIAVQVKKEFSFSLFDLDWEVFGVNIEGAINRVPAIEKTGVKSTVCGPGASVFLFISIYIQRWTVFGRPFAKRFALCYRSVVCPVCPVCDVRALLFSSIYGVGQLFNSSSTCRATPTLVITMPLVGVRSSGAPNGGIKGFITQIMDVKNVF